MEDPSKPEQRKKKAYLNFGQPGHEDEYVLHLADDDIPYDMADKIKEILGENWQVLDRGTRIEIGHKRKFGLRDDKKVSGAVEQAISDKYKLHK